jgi:hypothetical protein
VKMRSFAPYLTMKFWNGLVAIASILVFVAHSAARS